MIIVEIAQYIDSQGLGSFEPDTTTGDVYLEYMPDTPDDAVCVYSTGGAPADVSTSVTRPSAQIIVRGVDLQTTMERAESIFAAFNNLHDTEFTSGGTRVMLCRCRQSEAAYLAPDDNGRHEYTINLELITGGD